MLEIIDEYCWDKSKKVLTFDKHNIIGLRNFAHWNINRASAPTPLHYHSDIIEFHCLVKGERESIVQDNHYIVKGNELFITFPYEIHRTSDSAQSPCEFYGFQIDLKDRDHLLGLDSEYSNRLADLLSSIPERHLKVSATGIELLKKAFYHLSKEDSFDYYTGTQYLCCFLFELHNLTAVFHSSTKEYTPIQHTLSYIEKHFQENLTLEMLADISGYSVSRFKTAFKSEVGITPAEFVMKRKIEFTKQQLELTDYSLTDIAFQAGFSSSNYFCSVFKKYVDCTPTHYRRKCMRR